LAQALQNLLSNATRYTDPGGFISVTVDVEGSMVVTRVADTGRGIAPEAIEGIFELFVQAHGTRSPSDSGLGIGLRLARTLVELHGGALTGASEGPGKGSTFTMRLPLAADGVAASLVAADTEVAGTRRTSRAGRRRQPRLRRFDGEPARAARPPGRRGLTMPSKALEAAQRIAPEIVLLDLNMPGTNGFVVLDRLRKQSADRPMHIAAMTGYGQHADRHSTLSAGFDPT
jgi:CheY-like chemotaxis protein